MFRLEIFASSYIMMCVERLSYMFLCDRNPSAVSLKTLLAFAVRVPMLVSMDLHICRLQYLKAIWLLVVGFSGVVCGGC